MARCEEKVVRAPLSVDGGVRMEVRFLLYLPPSSPKNFTSRIDTRPSYTTLLCPPTAVKFLGEEGGEV